MKTIATLVLLGGLLVTAGMVLTGDGAGAACPAGKPAAQTADRADSCCAVAPVSCPTQADACCAAEKPAEIPAP